MGNVRITNLPANRQVATHGAYPLAYEPENTLTKLI